MTLIVIYVGMLLRRLWNLHLNFFVQSLSRYETIDILWDEETFLSHYGHVSASDVHMMTFQERQHKIKKLKEWIKEEKKRESVKPKSRPATVRR